MQTMIGTGGIFAHATPARLARILSAARSVEGGSKRLLPRHPNLVVDRSYVMGAAGLLSVDHPHAAARLLHEQLAEIGSVREGTSDGH